MDANRPTPDSGTESKTAAEQRVEGWMNNPDLPPKLKTLLSKPPIANDPHPSNIWIVSLSWFGNYAIDMGLYIDHAPKLERKLFSPAALKLNTETSKIICYGIDSVQDAVYPVNEDTIQMVRYAIGRRLSHIRTERRRREEQGGPEDTQTGEPQLQEAELQEQELDQNEPPSMNMGM